MTEATALSRAERWEEARERFIQASLCPEAENLKNIRNDIAICCLNIGSEQEDHGKLREALQSYSEAIDLNPQYARACYARSRLLVRTRSSVRPEEWQARFSEAMVLLKKAAFIWPAYRQTALSDIDFIPVRREPGFALALRMLVA